MAVILKERHGWGIACAELLHLALQKFLLSLKLVLAAQCYLQALYCLLQHLPLAQKLHPAGRNRAKRKGQSEACTYSRGLGGSQEAAARGACSPFPWVSVLFLTLELTLQLTDRLLPAQHLFGGHSQFIRHRGQPAPQGQENES